jgi:hypothetical protein
LTLSVRLPRNASSSAWQVNVFVPHLTLFHVVQLYPAGAEAAPLPRRLSFAICQNAVDPPSGAGWLHEVKHDGHRVAVIADGRGKVMLRSRNGYDVTLGQRRCGRPGRASAAQW